MGAPPCFSTETFLFWDYLRANFCRMLVYENLFGSMFKLLLFGCSRVLLHNWFPRSSSPLIVQCFLSGNLTVFFSLAFSLRPVRARWEQKPARPRRHHRHRPEAWTRIHWMPGCQVLAALQMRAEAAHLKEQRAELRAQLKELVQRTLGGWNRVENLFLFAFARFFFCVRLVCHEGS